MHEGGWSGPCHPHRLCPLSLWPQLPWKHRILDRLVRVSTVVLRLYYVENWKGAVEFGWHPQTLTEIAGQEKIWLKFFLTQTHSEIYLLKKSSVWDLKTNKENRMFKSVYLMTFIVFTLYRSSSPFR